jgi:hypothetical protein
MAIFPMSGVLRGFPPSTYKKVRLPATAGHAGENPCACPVKCEAYFTGAAPAKMSGISQLIYKWKVLSFSSKKYLIYELETI